MKNRTLWSSNLAFILASIGSAIGLGNLWRFPYICAKNGGGAFLVAYFMALFSIGIPILLLEITSGHYHRKGLPGIMQSIKKNYEWIGWAVIGVSFVITCYYAIIMSWSLRYLIDSFSLAWGSNPKDHFYKTVLGLTSGPLSLGGIQWPILAGLVLSWVGIVACIWKGPETVSKIIYATVLLPWFILIIFVIRGVTLPGAINGLQFYLNPDWAMLLKPHVWLEAYTQIFFSLSIGFGIMFAYGSFTARKTNINKYVIIIAIADAMTAFLAGFAVFGGIGYLSHINNVPIAELKLSGPGLVFIIYPTIINNLPFLKEVFAVLFFLMLLALAIDSAFSLVEAVSSAVEEKLGYSKQKSNIIVALTAFTIGIIFSTGAGLYWLDIADHFITTIGLGMACLLECIIIGRIFGVDVLRKYANKNSTFSIGRWGNHLITIIIPILIIVFLIDEVIERFEGSYENYGRLPEFIGGWLVLILVIIVSIAFSKKSHNKTR